MPCARTMAEAPVSSSAAGEPARSNLKPSPSLRRIGRALGHPVRLRILLGLVTEDGSAAVLSKRFGDLPLTNIDYHLKVLDRDCDVLEVVRTRRVRGAKERFYRLRPWPRLADSWLSVPQPVTNGFRGAAFGRFVELAVEAARFGGFDGRKNTVFTGRPIALDEQGWSEVTGLLEQAVTEIDAAEVRARDRLEQGAANDVVHAIVGVAAFETVADPQ